MGLLEILFRPRSSVWNGFPLTIRRWATSGSASPEGQTHVNVVRVDVVGAATDGRVNSDSGRVDGADVQIPERGSLSRLKMDSVQPQRVPPVLVEVPLEYTRLGAIVQSQLLDLLKLADLSVALTLQGAQPGVYIRTLQLPF